MYKAVRSDRNLVVDIITETFLANPGVNWMFSESGNRQLKIKRLAEYAFIKCLHLNGVFLSENNKGVALCFLSDPIPFSFETLFYQLKFAILSVPVSKWYKLLKREHFRKSKRPNHQAYYYFWFLGVLKDGNNAGFELNREIINIAQKEEIPIYLETTLERNKFIYERLGYQTYHYWKDNDMDTEFWFLKWTDTKY